MKPPLNLNLQIPLTSANLGPGFDIFGVALKIRCSLQFEFTESRDTFVLDENQKVIYGNEDQNLIRESYFKTLSTLKHRVTNSKEELDAPGFKVTAKMPIPPGRGFGSSAVARLAGFAAALHILKSLGAPMPTLDEEMTLLSALEGHPDNICAARRGGWNFFHTSSTGKIISIQKKVPERLGILVLHPGFSISTDESRSVLPVTYPIADILSNLSGVGMWLAFLDTGNFEYLKEALDSDRLHEPHRIPHITGFMNIKNKLVELGVTGVSLSGAGPGMIAFFEKGDREKILSGLSAAATVTAGWIFQECDIDPDGLIVG